MVGIGASAGGLAAIKTLLEGLPSAPDMAFVVVLHLSPTHESNAAAILQVSTRMPVTQVNGRMKIERDHVYVIPPTHDLSMVDGSLALVEAARPRGRHIVVDLFFRTLAEAHRERAIGIVLSGTGADGSAGIGRLKEHGGIVMAQLPEDAEYDGMPSSAIATGKVDIVLPVAEIPERLIQLWSNARQIEIPDAEKVSPTVKPPSVPAVAEEALRDIMKTLHQRTGHDFKNYKRATVLRRIERRLQVNGLPDLIAYRRFLRELRRRAEGPARGPADRRDPVLPRSQGVRGAGARGSAEAAREHGRGLSRYAPGWPAAPPARRRIRLRCCSPTSRGAAARPGAVTVFATDIDEAAIATGRAGYYPEGVAVDVPPSRLRTSFSTEPGGYRVSKALRDTVIFAVHNVLRDPPFSRLDLVSCRNLLIYLDRPAQQQVLEMFHFSLRPGGYLFLGTSETVDVAPRFFTPVDKVHRLYRANPVGRPLRALPAVPTLDRGAGAARRPAAPQPSATRGRRRPPTCTASCSRRFCRRACW